MTHVITAITPQMGLPDADGEFYSDHKAVIKSWFY